MNSNAQGVTEASKPVRPAKALIDDFRIDAVEAVPFQLPVRREFKWAGLQKDIGSFVLVRIRTKGGAVGYGEATPLPDWGGDFGRRGGETQATVVAMIRDILGPLIMARSSLDIPQLLAAMDGAVVGHNYAKCAIDIALHDLLGKALNAPLYRLFGGAARASVGVAHMVGLMPLKDAVAEGVAAASDGLLALQIKGGVDAKRDIELIGSLRRELGPDVKLRLDANQGYREVKRASRIIAALADAGVDYVEQPVEGHARMAEVRRAANVPVIADESCWTAPDALEVIARESADYLSVYLAKAGGLAGANRVASIAQAAGMLCDVNGSIESGIGTAANVHFALANAAVDLASVIAINAPEGTHPFRTAGRYYEDDIIAEALPVTSDGLLPLDGPGLGIDVDEAKVRRYACS